jgi:hypothetical protein
MRIKEKIFLIRIWHISCFKTFEECNEDIGRVPMKCHRCGGIMAHEKFYGNEPFWGWKCINCGEVFDPVILENRNGFGKLTMQRRWIRNGRYVRRLVL